MLHATRRYATVTVVAFFFTFSFAPKSQNKKGNVEVTCFFFRFRLDAGTDHTLLQGRDAAENMFARFNVAQTHALYYI